jgi:hypothetical protein
MALHYPLKCTFTQRIIIINTLLEILGFATKIQFHVTHVTANLCGCIRQVAHDI